MKNGFTLVELLAILVLLGIIVIVAVPSVIESNRISKENEIKEFTEAVEMACESYAAVNPTAVGTSVSIKEVLIKEGYLKANLENPNTGEKISNENKSVTITKNPSTNEITCNYPN